MRDARRTEPRDTPRHSRRHREAIAAGLDPRDAPWPERLRDDAQADARAQDLTDPTDPNLPTPRPPR